MMWVGGKDDGEAIQEITKGYKLVLVLVSTTKQGDVLPSCLFVVDKIPRSRKIKTPKSTDDHEGRRPSCVSV